MMRERLAGFAPLYRVSLRQELTGALPWIIALAALSASSIPGYSFVVPDDASRQALATTIGGNPAFSLILGPAHDLTTADGFNAWRSLILGSFLTGLMAILIVTRNSRANEDSGQAELIASGVVGRQTRLAVAVALAQSASLAVGVLAAAATIAVGGNVESSILIATAWTVSGLMLSGVAAISAQLGSSSSAANSIALATLGGMFLIRGYGDAGTDTDWATWLSPLGWLAKTEPSTGNAWWPLLLSLAFAVVAVIIANVLQERRDFGQGVIPPRPGRDRAGTVGTIWGFTWRLNRGSIIGWSLALAVIGALFGTVTTSMGDLIADNPDLGRMVAAGAVTEQTMTASVIVMFVTLMGIIAAVPGVQIVTRIRTEENDYRVEPLLAAGLRRSTYLAATACFAFGLSAVAILIGGTTMAVVTTTSDVGLDLLDVIWQAAVVIPAVWTLVALALAAIGLRSGLYVLGWIGIAGFQRRDVR